MTPDRQAALEPVAREWAVLRRWKDNPSDFEVVEYCATQQEAEQHIAKLSRSHYYNYEVGHYE